jgi:hypothetical protein
MPETTVFLLDIIDSNSLHGPVRELYQENGISSQINQSIKSIGRQLVRVISPSMSASNTALRQRLPSKYSIISGSSPPVLIMYG